MAKGGGPENRWRESARGFKSLTLLQLFLVVAQTGSAPALGAGCRRFKSSRPDHFRGCSSTGERLPCKQDAMGSSPFTSTNFGPAILGWPNAQALARCVRAVWRLGIDAARGKGIVSPTSRRRPGRLPPRGRLEVKRGASMSLNTLNASPSLHLTPRPLLRSRRLMAASPSPPRYGGLLECDLRGIIRSKGWQRQVAPHQRPVAFRSGCGPGVHH